MGYYAEQHKIALVSSLEVVLMSMGNTKYNLLVAKLDSLYNMTIRECHEHPEYLKSVLKEVYSKDYDAIISEVKAHLDELIDEEDMVSFFKVMES
ncbi:MAG: hypothetical protein ACREBB_04110 [Nitrosotalea sp.]